MCFMKFSIQNKKMEDKDNEPLLEVSIPPLVKYCNFCLPTENISQKDPPLLYFESGFSPKLYHQILLHSGFQKTVDISRASLIIGSNKEEKSHKTLMPHQKIEHYLHTFKIGSKVGMHAIMTIYKHQTMNKPSFYPETFLLPEELDLFQKYPKEGKTWIVKPTFPSPSHTIYITKEVNEDFHSNQCIVQEYITNPLLVNGFKFDLRCYVALTSLDPLRIYVYNDGIVRFAASKYEENKDDLTKISAHFPNISATRKVKSQPEQQKEKRQHKAKWSHDQLWAYLETIGIDSNAIRADVDDAITTYFSAARPQLLKQKNHRLSMELYGVDVLLDANCGVHILGINISPALGVKSSLDIDIKSALVRDFLNISLIPCSSYSQVALEMEMEEGSHKKLKEYIAISEFEEVERRRNGWRIAYPSLEYDRRHGPIYFETKLDSVLRYWLTIDHEKKVRFAQRRAKSIDRFNKSVITYTSLCRV